MHSSMASTPSAVRADVSAGAPCTGNQSLPQHAGKDVRGPKAAKKGSAPTTLERSRFQGNGALRANRKRDKQQRDLVKDRYVKCLAMLDLVIKHPISLDVRPYGPELRSKLIAIAQNPRRYGLENSDQTAKAATAHTERPKEQLSCGFIAQLHRDPKAKPDYPPVLHIIVVERVKKRPCNWASGGKFQTHIRLTVCDGEHKMLGIVATNVDFGAGKSLRSTKCLDKGQVMRVEDWNVVAFDAMDSEDERQTLALIIKRADWLGYKPIPNDNYADCGYLGVKYKTLYRVKEKPTSTTSVEVVIPDQVRPGDEFTISFDDTFFRVKCPETSAPGSKLKVDIPMNSEPATKMACRTSSTDAQPSNPDTHEEAERSEDPYQTLDPECGGLFCSNYGVVTDTCLVDTIAVPDLRDIVHECYFVDKHIDDMSSSEKRNVTYWWWAVNVYQVRGRSKRIEMPMCILIATRKKYPESAPYQYSDAEGQNPP